METTTKLLNAYRADPIRVCMRLERAARRARAEEMSRLAAKAAGFIASGFGRLAAGWVGKKSAA